MVGLQYASIMTALGPKLNGIVNYDFWVPEPTLKFEGVEEFLAKYQKAAEGKGVDPIGYYLQPYAYAYLQVLDQAITATDSMDHAEIGKYMRDGEFDTVVGKVKFAPNGEWAKTRVLQVQYQGIEGQRARDLHEAGHAGGAVPGRVGVGRAQLPLRAVALRAPGSRSEAERTKGAIARKARWPPKSRPQEYVFSIELLLNALVAGVLLGGFYAAVSLGLTVAFGQLNIVNIAHPAFVILGSYVAYMCNSRWGLDPILVGLAFTPVFFLIGVGAYRIYYESFERKDDESLRGLAFFFGVMFIIEVGLIMVYGVDFRTVQAPYIGQNFKIGGVGVPTRMFVPFCVSLAMFACVYLYMSRTFNGRAIMAVAQDRLALQLMAADPVPDQAARLRHRHRHHRPCGGAPHHHHPHRALDRAALHRAGLRDRGSRGARLDSGDARGGPRPRHRGEPRRYFLRTVLGAGRRVRHPPPRARVPAPGTLRPMKVRRQ